MDSPCKGSERRHLSRSPLGGLSPNIYQTFIRRTQGEALRNEWLCCMCVSR